MNIKDKLLTYLIKNELRGKDRLINLFAKLGLSSIIKFKAKYDIQLYLNPKEYIDNIIIKEGFYESEITEEILMHLKGDGVFWDIGGNIGIHSIAIKKKLPNTKVYCFEPNPKTLKQLCENVKLNDLEVKVCSFALFDKINVMTLHLAEGNSGMTTLTPWHEIQFSSTVQCLTTTGDKLISDGYDLPTIIKLDTEGSEVNVLKGCKNILANQKLKAIIFEADKNLLECMEHNETALFLNEFGFNQIKLLIRNEVTHHGLSNFVAKRNNYC